MTRLFSKFKDTGPLDVVKKLVRSLSEHSAMLLMQAVSIAEGQENKEL